MLAKKHVLYKKNRPQFNCHLVGKCVAEKLVLFSILICYENSWINEDDFTRKQNNFPHPQMHQTPVLLAVILSYIYASTRCKWGT